MHMYWYNQATCGLAHPHALLYSSYSALATHDEYNSVTKKTHNYYSIESVKD